MRRVWGLPAGLLLWSGCGDTGCLSGNDLTCTVPAACDSLAFTCDGGTATVRVLDSLDGLPLSAQTLASPGDILLSNDHVWVVIDALDHPHLFSESGGSIIDMGTWGGAGDTMQQAFQAAGLLPSETAVYTDVRLIDEGDVQGVQFLGSLAGNTDLAIATRYDIRACEPGIRVRTELVNRGTIPRAWMLLDAFWWGGRGLLPYSPNEDGGFSWPDWDLLTIADGFVTAPYIASGLHDGTGASYATMACDREDFDAIHSESVSAAGQAPVVIQPRDYLTYERFIAAGAGPSVSAATDPIYELRRQLFNEPYVTVTGELFTGGVPATGGALRASVEIRADGRPVTQVVPATDGTFSARVPAAAALELTVSSFGQEVVSFDVVGSGSDMDAGRLDIPEVGALDITATLDGEQDVLLAFVLPADDATEAAVRGDVYGHWDTCAPLLGLPHGSSPACNRVLVEGPTTVPILPGVYDIFATAGPFSSLGVARGVQVTAGGISSAQLELVRFDLQPEGTLSGDFHVHGGASWDAGMEDFDRVRAFLAADIDVIVSTEHNAAWNYADAIERLGADSRIQLITGTENTGIMLFDVLPETLIPKVTGHWNFWPVVFDPEGPYRGSWWDQKALPGELFNRASAAGWPASTGIAQLNHPTSELSVGRDFGWADTIELDLNRDVADAYDGTPHSLFADAPDGGMRNSDFHTTEVMNGTSNSYFAGYRAIWWWMLDQGLLRGGTANSDSHTLTENVLGTPRTLVWTDQEVGVGFNIDRFNESVRDGRMVGTNGPVIEASIVLGDAEPRLPSLTPFVPDADAVLHIEVRAAPWVPVSEVRVIVNGQVMDTFTDVTVPSDPTSSSPDDLLRIELDLPVRSLLPTTGDAWISIEAGVAVPLSGDLDCDGIPDTGDTNGDGTVDWRDVVDLEEEPEEACFDDTGPVASVGDAERDTPLWFFQTTVPKGYPAAFTNPFVFDLDGGGFEGVAR
ncbi:MAG: hypothetical protein ACJATT_001208 [Myxococcota bacterium]